MAKILSGERLAKDLLGALSKRASVRNLKLAVVLVGDQGPSRTYVEQKRKAAFGLGIAFALHRFPDGISTEELKREVENIGKDPLVSAMIVQLPLPPYVDRGAVLNSIPLEKDADLLSDRAFERFQRGTSPILPPVVGAVRALLEEAKVSVKGKRVALVGMGRLVGLPLSIWFAGQGAVVRTADKSTPDLTEITRPADIVVSGAGKQGLITGDMVQEGAVVIDAGTSVEEGRSGGDVNTASVKEKAGALAPVPGGVGPLTVAYLLENAVKLNE